MPSRRFNICITLSVTAIFALLSAFLFAESYLRLAEAFRDFGNSTAYYFAEIFKIEHNITSTVTMQSSVLGWEILLPEDWETFKIWAREYFSLLVDGTNVKMFFAKAGVDVASGAKVIAIALPCVLLLIVAVGKLYASGNTKHNRDTLPLRAYKEVTQRCFCR